MLMAMMGGLFWPVAVMPDFMQRIAMLLPTYWLVKSTEIITTATASIELIVPLTVLFLFTVAFLLVGSRGEIA
jgi:ABC-2 type transport system permease protein